MTTTDEIHNLIEQTTTGAHRRRVFEEIKQGLRRYSECPRNSAPTQSPEFSPIGFIRFERPSFLDDAIRKCRYSARAMQRSRYTHRSRLRRNPSESSVMVSRPTF